MRIIRKGKYKPNKCEITCDYCNSVIEFLETDKELKLVADERDGNYYETKCPICKNVLTIDARLMGRI